MSTTQDFFPDEQLLRWLPGETLFSLLSRQHFLSGESHAWRTVERYFGCSHSGFQHDLPSRLASFVARTGGKLGDVRSVALNHTLLSFYRAFIPAMECSQIIEGMREDSVVHSKMRLGISRSRFRAHHPLKACQMCMMDDMQLTGWAYWRLEHQYPGVWTCIKHSQPLLVAKLKAKEGQRLPWSLPRSNELHETHAFTSSDTLDRLNRLSRLIGDLVRIGTREPFSVSSLYLVYQNAMKSRGWMTDSGRFRMKAAASAFLEHISRVIQVDEFNGLPQTSGEANDMLVRMLRPSRTHVHPLQHILMVDWLFTDPSKFKNQLMNL
ncbi:TnsD family Tn7-like transposition protein [Comamonas thiooxydans]|uniref:TnsD family Tn7-like transposition protein n=1 Tax=Comamonas thiooxydans TaxID=363952 RepID=UPI0010398D05|nr:TnsD family Tn7-like transposition protein [Comamonas thiooxydans]